MGFDKEKINFHQLQFVGLRKRSMIMIDDDHDGSVMVCALVRICVAIDRVGPRNCNWLCRVTMCYGVISLFAVECTFR